MKNLNITGTFNEYVESIVEEIKQLLSASTYLIRMSDSVWGTATKAEGGTVVKVIFLDGNGNGPNVCFSIAELEFMTLQQYASEGLIKLAEGRFEDAIDSLENVHNVFGMTLKELRRKQISTN